MYYRKFFFRQLINYLIQKWRYDHTTLLSSESKDDFTAYFYPPPSTVYGPPNYSPNNVISPSEGYYPEPIYIPKPQHPFQDNGQWYIPPKVTPGQNYTNGLGDYLPRKNSYQQQSSRGGQLLNYKYSNNIPAGRYSSPAYYEVEPQIAQYNNNIWKR